MSKWDSDKIFSVSAFLISVATLATLVYQSQIMREHQEKTSFPKLELWNNNSDTRYQLELKNTGMGPAILEEIKVVFNDSTYELDPAQFAHRYKDTLNALYPLGTSSLRKGRVIEPGVRAWPINISYDSIRNHPIANIFRSEEATVIIRYSSVYQHQWEIIGTGTAPTLLDEEPQVIKKLLGD
ncbi:MAG: hypothetical protein ABJF11_12925 [Reichenbachiella sp.]|uniref:hypothetical protein n=1 Tax=Reichenbachiella sp. TaxID=2184521 RepID=UPI003267C298